MNNQMNSGGLPLPPYFTRVQNTVAKTMREFGDAEEMAFHIVLGDNFYNNGVASEFDHRFEVSN